MRKSLGGERTAGFWGSKFGGAVRQKLFGLTVFLLALGCLGASVAQAQVLYGSIVGNVEDSSGAALPGATVTITSKETGLSKTVVTNDVGSYTFTNVLAGVYDVKVSLQCFKESVKADVPVTVNTVSRADAKLEIGALT